MHAGGGSLDGLILWFSSRTPVHWGLIVTGFAMLALAAVLASLWRAWAAEEYRGVRERPPGELAPWQREPTGERPAVSRHVVAIDTEPLQRLRLDPEWRERMAREMDAERWRPRPAWSMPTTNTGAHHHRRNGNRSEPTRTMHPGYRAVARSRVEWIGPGE